MRSRWILFGVAIVAVALLTAGLALAAGRGGTGPGPSDDAVVAAGDVMHRSGDMRDLPASMLGDARERCEAMHAQMGRMMAGMGPMMGGAEMMGSPGGPGMMGPGDGGWMSGHHASGPRAR